MTLSQSAFNDIKKQFESKPYARTNISVQKGNTIAYWAYRLKRPFVKLRYKRFQKANPKAPWLTPDAIAIFPLLLNSKMSGLEYGSGRSTIYFSALLSALTSIEHNKEWYDHVLNWIDQEGLKNVKLKLIAPDTPNQMPALSSEEDVFISAENYPNKDTFYQSYANYLDALEDESLEFIIVDGRARVSCAKKAIAKLKSGGIFSLDNSERKRYDEIHKMLEQWPSIYTTTGLTDTTIWRKP